MGLWGKEEFLTSLPQGFPFFKIPVQSLARDPRGGFGNNGELYRGVAVKNPHDYRFIFMGPPRDEPDGKRKAGRGARPVRAQVSTAASC